MPANDGRGAAVALESAYEISSHRRRTDTHGGGVDWLTGNQEGRSHRALGICATVLFAMGMVERLADVADPKYDSLGRELEEEYLPKRIRGPRTPKRIEGA